FLTLDFQTRAGPFSFLETRIDIPSHAMSLGQEQARVTFESAIAFPLVIEKIEYGLRGAGGLFGAECIEGGLCQTQAVLDSFVGNVSLREMVDQLRIHARSEERRVGKECRSRWGWWE